MFKGTRDYIKHVRMVSRNAQLFLLGGFFLGIGQATFNSMANLYFEELGFSRSQIGGFRSVQQLGIVLVAIPTALLITRFRAKNILAASAVLSAAGYIGQAFGQNFGVILAFCSLVGVSTGVVRLSMAPLFIRSSSAKERVYLFGMHRVVRMLIAVGATLLAGKIIADLGIYYGSQVLGYRYVLAGAGLLALLGAIPFLMVRTEELTGAEEQKKFNLFKIRNKKTILKVCTPQFFVGAGAGLFIPFVNLYFKDVLGAGPAQVAAYMSIGRFLMVIGFIAAPLVARRFGMLRSVVATEILSIPFLLIMAMWFHFGSFMIIFAYAARQSLMNMTQPLAANFSLEVVPPREQAITNSMRMLAGNAGRALFALIGGIINDRYGFTPVILGTAVFYLAAASSYIIFFRKHKLYQSQVTEDTAGEDN